MLELVQNHQQALHETRFPSFLESGQEYCKAFVGAHSSETPFATTIIERHAFESRQICRIASCTSLIKLIDRSHHPGNSSADRLAPVYVGRGQRFPNSAPLHSSWPTSLSVAIGSSSRYVIAVVLVSCLLLPLRPLLASRFALRRHQTRIHRVDRPILVILF